MNRLKEDLFMFLSAKNLENNVFRPNYLIRLISFISLQNSGKLEYSSVLADTCSIFTTAKFPHKPKKMCNYQQLRNIIHSKKVTHRRKPYSSLIIANWIISLIKNSQYFLQAYSTVTCDICHYNTF